MTSTRLGDPIRRRVRRLPTTVLTALGFVLLVAGSGVVLSAQPAPQCTVIDGPVLPQHVSSAVWSPKGDKVLLADPSPMRRVMVYSSEGDFLGVMPNPTASLGVFSPLQIRRYRDEIAVEVRPRELLFVDARYRLLDKRDKIEPTRSVNTLETRSAGLLAAVPSGEAKLSIRSMFLFEFAGDDVIACSDLLGEAADGKKKGSTGIVRFPVDDPESFRAYQVSYFRDAQWIYCRLGFPYIATLGDQGFVLLFGDEPGLYRSEPGADKLVRLEEYPSEYLQAPTLSEFAGPGELAAVMAQIQGATLPVGLYAWGGAEDGALYVLRRVADREGSPFLLDKVDPIKGRILGTAEIQTDAKHLLLVPGKQWLMVEKGEFISPDFAQVEQLRLIPGELFAGAFGGKICN